MSTLKSCFVIGLLLAGVASGARAAPADDSAMKAAVHHIDDEWARITYRVADKDEQLTEIKELANQAAQVVVQYPGRAEPLLWQGIVTSEEAGMASVFRQLGLAIAARRIFEHAEAIDPKGVNGAVQMSLGVLYYRVPGFPIGFGNDKLARTDLETALAVDPNGLDANFFYGDFLAEQGAYVQAKTVLDHALAAPVDAARPIWDAGRRAEVRALLVKVDQRLNG